MKVFVVKKRYLVEWKYMPLLVPYCCVIIEGKKMSTVQYGAVVSRSFISCLVIRNHVIEGELVGERQLMNTRKPKIVLKSSKNLSNGFGR